MSYESDYSYVFTFPGTLPPTQILQFSNLNLRIRGISVKNQSNCNAGFYVSRNAGSLPDYIVLALQTDAQPIPFAPYIAIQWMAPSGAAPAGSAFVVITTEQIVANSAPLAALGGGVGIWDSSIWDASNWG
jgi:hypothetical protein